MIDRDIYIYILDTHTHTHLQVYLTYLCIIRIIRLRLVVCLHMLTASTSLRPWMKESQALPRVHLLAGSTLNPKPRVDLLAGSPLNPKPRVDLLAGSTLRKGLSGLLG